MQINTMKIKPSMNTSLNKQLVLSHLCFFCRLLAVDIQIFKVYIKKKNKYRASLLAQWIRTYLLMQETRVQSLVQEDSTCRGVTKLMGHNF